MFGPGVAERLGREAAALGRRAFVLTGSRPQAHAALLRQLGDHHVAHTLFRVDREPTTDLAREAVAHAASGQGCDLVIGIGGGSVIDTGKVVAALMTNGGELMDYLEVVGRGQPLRRAVRAVHRPADHRRDGRRGHAQRRAGVARSTGSRSACAASTCCRVSRWSTPI